MARRREWLLAAGSLGACLLLAAAAEAILRWRPPASLERTPLASPVVYSAAYGWELRRSWRGRDAGGAPITLDAQGRRLVPRPAAAVRTARRVLMLGDSIAFGPGVSDEETFSHRLQEVDPALEVLNLSVPGYGTDQALLRLQREGVALRPDVVVLHFCVANDVVDNALSVYLYDARRPKPYFTLEGGGLKLHDGHLRQRALVRLASALQERSYLINALGSARARADEPAPEGHFQQREKRVLRDLAAATALTARLVAAVEEASRGAGARVIVLVHPDRSAFEGESELAEAVLGAMPASVEAVDLRHEYLALDLAFRDVALDGVGHLNARGHEILARVLHRLVTRPPAPAPSRVN